jgi:hypothetical protein
VPLVPALPPAPPLPPLAPASGESFSVFTEHPTAAKKPTAKKQLKESREFMLMRKGSSC